MSVDKVTEIKKEKYRVQSLTRLNPRHIDLTIVFCC